MLKDQPAHRWPRNIRHRNGRHILPQRPNGGNHRPWHPKIDRTMTPPTVRVNDLGITHTKGFSPAAIWQRLNVSITRGRMCCVGAFPIGVGPPTRFNAAALSRSMARGDTNVKMLTTRSMSTSQASALLSAVLPQLNSTLMFQT